jgi:hypothetical protein
MDRIVCPYRAAQPALAAIVIFALLHAATVPAAAWRPGVLPFTAAGTVTPFLLLIILIERVELWNPTPFLASRSSSPGFCSPRRLLGARIGLRSPACFGAGLVEWTWQADAVLERTGDPTLVCYALFLVFFVAFPFCSAQKEKTWSWALSALAQVLQFWLTYGAITLAFPNEWMGLLPAIFVLPGAIGVGALLKLYRANPASGDARTRWQGGALLLFVSLIFPLSIRSGMDHPRLGTGGSCSPLALHRVPHRGLRLVAVVLLARLSLGWHSIPRSSNITSAPSAESGTGMSTPME